MGIMVTGDSNGVEEDCDTVRLFFMLMISFDFMFMLIFYMPHL